MVKRQRSPLVGKFLALKANGGQPEITAIVANLMKQDADTIASKDQRITRSAKFHVANEPKEKP